MVRCGGVVALQLMQRVAGEAQSHQMIGLCAVAMHENVIVMCSWLHDESRKLNHPAMLRIAYETSLGLLCIHDQHEMACRRPPPLLHSLAPPRSSSYNLYHNARI